MARSRRAGSRVQVVAWVPPSVLSTLDELAHRQGISRSAAAGVLLAEALRADLEHQHASLIEATIERVLIQQLARLQETTTRAAVDAHTARRLVPQVLMRQGLQVQQVRGIVRKAREDAWKSLGEPAERDVDEGAA